MARSPPRGPTALLDTARGALAERGVNDARDTYAGPADPEREKSIQWEAERLFYRISEIRTRARLVNDVLQPDVTLCLHFNAEEWGDPAKPALVEKNHLHLLVSGNYSAGELRYDDVRFEMLLRLLSRVHEEEIPLAETVAGSLARATALPPLRIHGRPRHPRRQPALCLGAQSPRQPALPLPGHLLRAVRDELARGFRARPGRRL